MTAILQIVIETSYFHISFEYSEDKFRETDEKNGELSVQKKNLENCLGNYN